MLHLHCHGPGTTRLGALAAVALLVLGFCACSAPALRSEPPTAFSALAPLPSLPRDQMLWLQRMSFGVDPALLQDYQHLGRERFLDQQLQPHGAAAALPAAIAAQIDALQISHADSRELLATVQAQNKSINTLLPAQRLQARKALAQIGNDLANEAIRRELLRAIYSPAQLQEQMVWFWLNHFSVSAYKGNVSWLVGDYEESAIRPHALGRFRDLVLATLSHPAMLQYLDNQENRAGHLNENYARELMELHTLGVDAGYTQQDVQQLARILTGVGINTGAAPRLSPALQSLYLRHGAFEFNPARHDFGPKVLLGQRIRGQGFREVKNAVTLIVRQPACARFISQQLATYFVGEQPAPALVAKMAQTFQHTDGDIAAVLRTMLLSPEFDAALGSKFKDPMRYVVSAIRFSDDGRTLTNVQPLINWLRALGEAPYGRQTPDGYPLGESGWASPGQMSRRFEIARMIGASQARLFGAAAGAAPLTSFPSRPLYLATLAPFLAPGTRSALASARSPQEWNTYLFASPEFNYE